MRFQKIIFCLFVITIVGFLASQRVQQDQVLETLLDKSAKYVGVDYPHSLGYTGDGIKVAVIDTGVDYTHPDLLGFGPEGKVIGGYDFVENDDTPQDTNGHGTEVAGIIAANGNLKGIAPDAKILAYRVSDTGNAVSSDLIVSAIERAVKDGANIINISLGVNRTNNKIDDAINFAVKNGVVVVAAAGNSGPDPSTIGSPGKDPNAITVGATYNNITASLVATLTVDHKRVEVLPMVGSKPLSNPITAEIVYGGYGRQNDLQNIDAKDKILLIERGSDKEGELVYFSEKEKNSANAGASAILVYNNEPGIFLGDLNNKLEGPSYEPTIPALSMSREDGIALKSMLENKTTGTVDTFYHPDFVSFFSSRGPVSPFYLKPDLVAPGVFVNTTSIHGNYNLTSGTSFAAPHVSGAAAILLQKDPNLSPQEVGSILSTTADPISDTFGTQFPQEVSGVGRLNVTKAFEANLIVLPPYAVFDLSQNDTSQEKIFKIGSINGEKPDINVNFEAKGSPVGFEYEQEDSKLKVKATLKEQKTGQYEATMNISDNTSVYHIPVLLRVTNASININENNGRLDFEINTDEPWTYAKTTIFDTNYRLVGSTAMTPSSKEPLFIHRAGTYWVQVDLKAGGSTSSLYDSVVVNSTSNSVFNIQDLGLPTQALLVIVVIAAVVAVAGIIIRR